MALGLTSGNPSLINGWLWVALWLEFSAILKVTSHLWLCYRQVDMFSEEGAEIIRAVSFQADVTSHIP